jgi:hypothetical protein
MDETSFPEESDAFHTPVLPPSEVVGVAEVVVVEVVRVVRAVVCAKRDSSVARGC